MLAVVLAGGQSSRMGQDKALVPILGRPLLTYSLGLMQGLADNIALAADSSKLEACLPFLDAKPVFCVDDIAAGQEGPLSGLLAALQYLKGEAKEYQALVALASCDVFGLPAEVYQYLADQFELEENKGLDIAYITWQGKCQPLIAVLRLDQSLLASLQQFFSEGGRSVMAWYAQQNNKVYDLSQLLNPSQLSAVHVNMNYPELLVEEVDKD